MTGRRSAELIGAGGLRAAETGWMVAAETRAPDATKPLRGGRRPWMASRQWYRCRTKRSLRAVFGIGQGTGARPVATRPWAGRDRSLRVVLGATERPVMSDVKDQSFAGRRVRQVEDEFIVALDLTDTLCDLGCEVLGPASS